MNLSTKEAKAVMKAARRTVYAMRLPAQDCDDLVQHAVLQVLERCDPTRATPAVFASRCVGWRFADEARRYDRARRLEDRVAASMPSPVTPEEHTAQAEMRERGRRIAAQFSLEDLDLVLDEQPLRVRAQADGVPESTVWRRRRAVAKRIAEAAKRMGL